MYVRRHFSDLQARFGLKAPGLARLLGAQAGLGFRATASQQLVVNNGHHGAVSTETRVPPHPRGPQPVHPNTTPLRHGQPHLSWLLD